MKGRQMASLMERARRLVSSKTAVVGALTIVPLAASATSADGAVGPYFVQSTSVFVHNGSTSTDTPVTGTLSFSGVNPVKLFTSSPISIDDNVYIEDGGGQAGSHLALRWSGLLN